MWVQSDKHNSRQAWDRQIGKFVLIGNRVYNVGIKSITVVVCVAMFS